MTPADYVGMISFPSPGVRLDPTRDRKILEDAIPKLTGLSQLKPKAAIPVQPR